MSNSIPFKSASGIEYTGTSDFDKTDLAYGKKWNKKWLEKVTIPNTKEVSKATAYLCDTGNWIDYVTEPATYAIGGPTLELFLESWNCSQKTNISISDDDVNSVGYLPNKPDGLYNNNPILKKLQNGLYNNGGHYYLASPSDYADVCLVFVSAGGTIEKVAYWNTAAVGFRPLVSIPTSKVQVDGDTVRIIH